MSTEEVTEEIEAVTAILDEDTVDIVRNADDSPAEISIKITPLTASEQEKQYVSLTLVVSIPDGYPMTPPTLGVRNPRGLEENAVASLLVDMNSKCEEYTGCPVMFELIEMSREFLTERNVPVVRCIICLNNIQENDQFMKTECLHFFHRHCLGRYITNMLEDYDEQVKEAQKSNISIKEFQVTCPVCREVIGESRYNLSELLASQPPISEQTEPVKYKISDDVKKLQKKMQELFIKQKEKGGIIDLEAEQKKYLVVTNSGNDQDSEEGQFTELSPTDYQLDEAGIPCAKVSPPKSPAKSANNNEYEENYNFSYQSYQNNHFGKGRGRGGKRGFNRQGHSSESSPPTTAEVVEEDVQDERDRRNAHRRNHYLNKGKSHHQLKKDKKGVAGAGGGGLL